MNLLYGQIDRERSWWFGIRVHYLS